MVNRKYDHWWEYLGDYVRDAMKSWGLAVVIVLFALAFVWTKGGAWVDAKAEAEKTQSKTTADLSKTMLLLTQAQDRSERRINEAKEETSAFRTQVTREHTEAANALRELLVVLTDLVKTMKTGKNYQTPPTPNEGGA